jgi:hypothetical protein
LDGGACSLTSAARGQEFVITTSSIKAVDAWLGGVFE